MVSEVIELELGMEKFQSEEKLERYLLIPIWSFSYFLGANVFIKTSDALYLKYGRPLN